jgi:histidine triad (HIT) family protein
MFLNKVFLSLCMEECVFCRIAGGKIPERIFENRNFFSILDSNQKIQGHALIISKKHFENVLDMPSTIGSELLDCIKNTSLKLMEKYRATGFNIVNNTFESAGQIVRHVHFHILPRKKEDGLKLIT